MDQRHHISIFVRHCQIDRIAACNVTGRVILGGPFVVDQPTPFLCVWLRDQFLYRDSIEGRFGVELGSVLKRQLLGFDEGMNVIRATESKLAKIKSL